MALLYRRAQGSDIWHWCPNCSSWPLSSDREERTSLPKAAAICTECTARDAQGTCDDGR